MTTSSHLTEWILNEIHEIEEHDSFMERTINPLLSKAGFEGATHCIWFNKGFKSAMHRIVDHLDRQPHVPDWVSVEDCLPPRLHKVLFLWTCPGGNRNVSMGFHTEAGWDIYLPYHSYGLRDDLCPVTHWMEIPDYPKIPAFGENDEQSS